MALVLVLLGTALFVCSDVITFGTWTLLTSQAGCTVCQHNVSYFRPCKDQRNMLLHRTQTTYQHIWSIWIKPKQLKTTQTTNNNRNQSKRCFNSDPNQSSCCAKLGGPNRLSLRVGETCKNGGVRYTHRLLVPQNITT